MNWLKKQRIYLNNARKVVAQIKAGEWTPNGKSDEGFYYTLKRENLKLWVRNGGMFCDIVKATTLENMNAFGIFRFYVWWGAARSFTRKANEQLEDKSVLVL